MKDADLPTLKASNNILSWVLSRNPRKTFNSYERHAGSIFIGSDSIADLFVNFAEKDFRLKEGSRAIGQAKPDSSPSTDLTDFARDNQPDIGCFEEGANATVLILPLGPTEQVKGGRENEH